MASRFFFSVCCIDDEYLVLVINALIISTDTDVDADVGVLSI